LVFFFFIYSARHIRLTTIFRIVIQATNRSHSNVFVYEVFSCKVVKYLVVLNAHILTLFLAFFFYFSKFSQNYSFERLERLY
jgi:hypothetical protein